MTHATRGRSGAPSASCNGGGGRGGGAACPTRWLCVCPCVRVSPPHPGLLWQLRPSDVEVELLAHTRDVVSRELPAETGLHTGWVENGGLFIASNKQRLDEYKRLMSVGRSPPLRVPRPGGLWEVVGVVISCPWGLGVPGLRVSEWPRPPGRAAGGLWWASRAASWLP